MATRVAEITSLQADVGTIQAEQIVQTSQIDTSHSQLSLLIPLATVEHTASIIDLTARMVVEEAATTSQGSDIERLKSQINFLRTDGGVGHGLAAVPGWPI
jgi:hypothetical protein